MNRPPVDVSSTFDNVNLGRVLNRIRPFFRIAAKPAHSRSRPHGDGYCKRYRCVFALSRISTLVGTGAYQRRLNFKRGFK